MNSLIMIAEFALLALLLLLAYRMLTIIKADPLKAGAFPEAQLETVGNELRPSPARKYAKDHSDAKCQLVTDLHIISTLQERDCRSQGLTLVEATKDVRYCAVAWLYGAARALSPRHLADTDSLTMAVSQLASRKFGLKQSEVVQLIATLTRESLHMACFRSGLEGADFWRTNHHVPRAHSLHEAITSNAFV